MRIRTLIVAVLWAHIAAAPAAMAQTDVTFVTWGGNIAQEMKTAWFEPAIEGVDVNILEDSLKSYNDIRAQAAAGLSAWDIVDGAAYMCASDGRDGFLEPLDYSVIDTDGLPEGQVTEWSVPSAAYAMVLAYNKERYKDNPPTSWKDFFDVENFPGTRFFGPRATGSLEIALLADGVPEDQLFPMDVDRAFRKLNDFKPHVTGFASSYGAATQVILDGEADMTYLPDNRYYAAVREGANYGFTYNQAVMNFDCMMVPASSENKELAMKIIARIVSPEINANIVTSSGLSPSNVRSITEGHVPADMAKDLAMAPDNLKVIVMADNTWWSNNHQKLRLQERYDEFKAR